MLQVRQHAGGCYAEAEDFDHAIEWGTKALNLASERERPGCRERLKLYEAKKPYRDE